MPIKDVQEKVGLRPKLDVCGWRGRGDRGQGEV